MRCHARAELHCLNIFFFLLNYYLQLKIDLNAQLTGGDLEEFVTALEMALASEGPSCIVAKITETGRSETPEIEQNANLLRFRNNF